MREKMPARRAVKPVVGAQLLSIPYTGHSHLLTKPHCATRSHCVLAVNYIHSIQIHFMTQMDSCQTLRCHTVPLPDFRAEVHGVVVAFEEASPDSVPKSELSEERLRFDNSPLENILTSRCRAIIPFSRLSSDFLKSSTLSFSNRATSDLINRET